MVSNLGFSTTKYRRHIAVQVGPGIQNGLIGGEQVLNGAEQVSTDDIILVLCDAQAGVFLANTLNGFSW